MFSRVLLLLAFFAIATPAAAANVSIVIALSDQHMRVSVGGAPKYSLDVSTGRKGYATIFFRGGYAIHGTYDTKRLGGVASHGCIRLSPENARRLYNLVLQHGSGNVSIRVKA